MRRHTVALVTALIAVATMGSKCNGHSEWAQVQDPEIQIAREVLLTANEVVNGIDDIVAESYTGSDADFDRLERTVCILETMQLSIEAGWKIVRVWELALAQIRQKEADGEDAGPLLDDLKIYGTEWLNYVYEIAGLAILARNIAVEWGAKVPKTIDRLFELLGNFIGSEVTEPDLNCEEVIGWMPEPMAALPRAA